MLERSASVTMYFTLLAMWTGSGRIRDTYFCLRRPDRRPYRSVRVHALLRTLAVKLAVEGEVLRHAGI